MNCCKPPLEARIFVDNFLEFVSTQTKAIKPQVLGPERGERQKPHLPATSSHPPSLYQYYNEYNLPGCSLHHFKFCLVKPDQVYLRSGFTLCGPSVAIALKHRRKLKLVSRQINFVLTAIFSCGVTCSGICFYMQVYTCIYMQKIQ